MKKSNSVAAFEIVILVCVLLIKISASLPGHVHHGSILDYPSPIFSTRSDAEWNGQIIVFPTSPEQVTNSWIENTQAKIMVPGERKPAGQEATVHTSVDPILIQNNTEALDVGVQNVTVTASHMHHRTDLMDKHLNLHRKGTVSIKKGNENHSSRQPSSSMPIPDIILEILAKWLSSDVQAVMQPPDTNRKSVVMAIREEIKHLQKLHGLFYGRKVINIFDDYSNFTIDKEFPSKHQHDSLSKIRLVEKGHLQGSHQGSSLMKLQNINAISITLQNPYPSMAFENLPDLSKKSLNGHSVSNVNYTNDRKVYSENKGIKGAALNRMEVYVEHNHTSTLKPYYDTKRGNDAVDWVRKAYAIPNMNYTADSNGKRNVSNLVNDTNFGTEINTDSTILKRWNTTVTGLPSVLDASKSSVDSVKWMESTTKPKDFSTHVISTPTGGKSISNSKTTVTPHSAVMTLEGKITQDRELSGQELIHDGLLKIHNANSTTDFTTFAESNATKSTPIPLVQNAHSGSANPLQSTTQTNHQNTIQDMTVTDELVTESETTAYPYSTVNSRKNTKGSDLNSEMLMFMEFGSILNEI